MKKIIFSGFVVGMFGVTTIHAAEEGKSGKVKDLIAKFESKALVIKCPEGKEIPKATGPTETNPMMLKHDNFTWQSDWDDLEWNWPEDYATREWRLSYSDERVELDGPVPYVMCGYVSSQDRLHEYLIRARPPIGYIRCHRAKGENHTYQCFTEENYPY